MCLLLAMISIMWLTLWKAMKLYARGCWGWNMHEKDYSSYVDGLGNNLYGTELLKAKNV